MTQLKTFLTRLRSYFKTGNIKALKEAFIAGSHLLMHTFKVAIVLLLIFKFYSILGKTYTIKPFSVPKDLVESGFTGATVIKKIMDAHQKILHYNDSSTSQSRVFFRATSKKTLLIDAQIEEGKETGILDIDGIFKTGKRLLGSDDNTISGEITKSKDNLLTLKIYMPFNQTKSFTKSREGIDTLFIQAAEYIAEQTTPQYLAEYLIKKSVRNNDISSLKNDERLLEKADKLLSTLEYNYTTDKKKKRETNVQLIACRTSWHLAKAMKYLLLKKNAEKNSAQERKSENDYTAANEAAWNKANELKSSNDMAYYVLKLSTLMAVINVYKINNTDKLTIYEERTDSVIKDYKNKNAILSASLWWDRSDYFESNQAKGFINMSIGYLSYICNLDKYNAQDKLTSEDYFNMAIEQFHNTNSILPTDNNEIAARNSLAYYFKNKAQSVVGQYKKRDSIVYSLKAMKALDKALEANKSDGNIYDTYAEIIYDLNGKKPNELFYDKIKLALSNPKPIDGIAVKNYWLDARWKDLVGKNKGDKKDIEFIAILDSFGTIKNGVTKSSKYKKNKNNATP